MKASELREMTDQELSQRLRERTDDLTVYRLQLSTGAILKAATERMGDNVRAVRNARRDIARIKTVLRERELAAGGEAK